jgi:hypothetical protein
MAKKKLGRVTRPAVSKFKKGRKLFFIPLIFTSIKPEADLSALFDKYWQQTQSQVKKLEEKLTPVKKVYHELITSAGDNGIKAIEQMSAGSHSIVKYSLDRGAEFQPIEDEELLMEFMDWSRCLAIGPQSQKVFSQIYQSFLEVQKRRKEYIARRIDETLKVNEIGVLIMREGHQIQFPSDIQVFYVAPPSLDEIRRWYQESETRAREK